MLSMCSVLAAGELKTIKKAAEQGDVEAQLKLGTMYVQGEGVPEDDTKAVYWFHQAAEQGQAEAQSKLGFMYAQGEGVPEDDAEAVRLVPNGRRAGTGRSSIQSRGHV